MADRRRSNKLQDRVLLVLLAANIVMLLYCGMYLSEFITMIKGVRRHVQGIDVTL